MSTALASGCKALLTLSDSAIHVRPKQGPPCGKAVEKMQVIGLCRFSYPGEGGFQVEHASIEERIAYLYAPERMEARLAQFEAIALPGLKAQTDPDFTFIIVIGDSLPDIWRARLMDLIADFPQAQVQEHPPGPHRQVMRTAINAARGDIQAPCLQFRHDDDDAVAVDFVERLRGAAEANAQLIADNRLVAIDFERGFSARPGPGGVEAADCKLSLYGVALGMSVRGGVQQTIMNFAHKKMGQFMPVLRFDDSPMFVRGHNDHNDSRQKAGVAPLHLSPLDDARRRVFEERFAIREDDVKRIFGAL